ncbi:hypothetical protein [Desulfobacter curvatus]|uniref:hypothetical protein n=1 Tax=Desulfobacter curvatus TaxID=2290 RepID=UPI0012F9D508|nr:hypothetical protein [Desulfobacter curvatus]
MYNPNEKGGKKNDTWNAYNNMYSHHGITGKKADDNLSTLPYGNIHHDPGAFKRRGEHCPE